MALSGATSVSHIKPELHLRKGRVEPPGSHVGLAFPLGSTHSFRLQTRSNSDLCSFLLLEGKAKSSVLPNVGNVGAALSRHSRTRVVRCRAADGSSRNGAVAPPRRQSARAEAERDRQFVKELRRVMDSKDLPKLTVPSPAQLADRPDLAKGLRARGQFHVARLLGKYAASEQDSPAPFPPPGFPQPPSPPSQNSSQATPQASAGLAAPPQDGVPIGAPLRPASEKSIPPQFAVNPESQPKIPSSIFDQLEADAQRAASRGDRSARGGGRGIPLPARDSQATTEAVERLRQLGSAPDNESPTASPPRSSKPVTSSARSATPTAMPEAPSSPSLSVSERAARFLQTGKMDESAAFAASTSDGPQMGDGSVANGVEMEAPTAESIAAQKAALLKAKLRQRSVTLPAPPPVPALDSLQSQNEKLYREILSEQQQLQQMSLSERQVEDDFKTQTFEELKRIKEVLSNRESEVASMGEALKEARAQLNLLRAKSAAELAQARQEVVELQMKLRSAEKSLEGLKQVRVEYWGQGDVIQVAGSFNGWFEYFNMEPDLSTEIPPPEGGRGPMVFGCELWLYPGEYEVKFIVDGEWQIDLRREIVYRGMNQNNLLRVE